MTGPKLLGCYGKIHDAICGRFPNENLFHAQFLSSFRHHRTLSDWLKDKENVSVLDVGCGEQPYRSLLRPSCTYVGVDIETRHPSTVPITLGSPWPVQGPFDVILCTQVAEHVADLPGFCKEIARVLAPGGELLLSVPFLYPIHDVQDYRRLTPLGMAGLFPGWRVERINTFGGIGSTLVLLANTWVDNALSLTLPKRLLKGLIFPVRVPLHALLNTAALLVDLADGTDRYFHNSLVVLRKEDA